jgi:hypothetical protein
MKLNLLLLSVATLANAANGRYLRSTETAINLGSAKDFVILAKSGISTVADSTITGSIGVSPIAATAITGFKLTADAENEFSTSKQIVGGGVAYAADYAVPTPETLTTAVSDMELAYSEASARSNDDDDSTNPGEDGEIGGTTLTKGVYTFDSDIKISGNVYLQGTENDVFIIQTTGSIEQADGTKVLLSENSNVKASNVFWQVAGHVTVGAGAHMEGILLVKEKVLFKTGSTLDGRVFSQTACNLEQATITQPTV